MRLLLLIKKIVKKHQLGLGVTKNLILDVRVKCKNKRNVTSPNKV